MRKNSFIFMYVEQHSTPKEGKRTRFRKPLGLTVLPVPYI